jgi:hypothetical protein
MFRINSPLIALSALIAIGVVTLDGLNARTSNTAATNVAERFPAQDQTFAAYVPATEIVNAGHAATKTFVPSSDCVHEHWPYIADECLVSDEGVPVKPLRTIKIERPTKAPAGKVMIASTANPIR